MFLTTLHQTSSYQSRNILALDNVEIYPMLNQSEIAIYRPVLQ
jgi:hypothetical protein